MSEKKSLAPDVVPPFARALEQGDVQEGIKGMRNFFHGEIDALRSMSLDIVESYAALKDRVAKLEVRDARLRTQEGDAERQAVDAAAEEIVLGHGAMQLGVRLEGSELRLPHIDQRIDHLSKLVDEQHEALNVQRACLDSDITAMADAHSARLAQIEQGLKDVRADQESYQVRINDLCSEMRAERVRITNNLSALERRLRADFTATKDAIVRRIDGHAKSIKSLMQWCKTPWGYIHGEPGEPEGVDISKAAAERTEKLTALEEGLKQLGARVEEERVRGVGRELRFARIDQRIDHLDERLDGVSKRLDGHAQSTGYHNPNFLEAAAEKIDGAREGAATDAAATYVITAESGELLTTGSGECWLGLASSPTDAVNRYLDESGSPPEGAAVWTLDAEVVSGWFEIATAIRCFFDQGRPSRLAIDTARWTERGACSRALRTLAEIGWAAVVGEWSTTTRGEAEAPVEASPLAVDRIAARASASMSTSILDGKIQDLSRRFDAIVRELRSGEKEKDIRAEVGALSNRFAPRSELTALSEQIAEIKEAAARESGMQCAAVRVALDRIARLEEHARWVAPESTEAVAEKLDGAPEKPGAESQPSRCSVCGSTEPDLRHSDKLF
jgi:hypothetical protein